MTSLDDVIDQNQQYNLPEGSTIIKDPKDFQEFTIIDLYIYKFEQKFLNSISLL